MFMRPDGKSMARHERGDKSLEQPSEHQHTKEIAGGESGLNTKSPLVRDVFNVYRPWPSSRNPAAETAHVRTNPCAGSGCEDSYTCDWVGRTHSGRHL
jgi:hypothetical protein